jgi:hypothetical protein
LAERRKISPEMKRSNLRFALLLPLFFMFMFPLCMVNALHNPVPHEVPVAVVGDNADGLVEQAGPKMAGAVDFRTVGSEDEAQRQLLDQKVRAVYEPGGKGEDSTMTVVGADGRILSQLLPTIFEPLAEASGGELQVNDIAPLASGDANGIGLMFYMLVCCLLGFLTANIVGNAAFFLRMPVRLLISAGVAVLAPSVLWLLMGAWMKVLQGSPGQIIATIAVGAAASFTVGLIVHSLVVFLGKWAIFPSILTFVFLNIPSSNSAYPMEFVPAPFGWISHVHLGAAMVNTVRSILYLHGDGIGRGLRVMAVWFVVGVVLMVFALWRRRYKARIEAAEDAADRAREEELAEERDEAAAATVGASPAGPALLGVVRTNTGVPVPGGQLVMLDADGREAGIVGVGEDGRFSFGHHSDGRHAPATRSGAQSDARATDGSRAHAGDRSGGEGGAEGRSDGVHGPDGRGSADAPGVSAAPAASADDSPRRHGRHEATTDDDADESRTQDAAALGISSSRGTGGSGQD